MNSLATNEIDFARRMVGLGAEFTANVGDRWSMISPEFGGTATAPGTDQASKWHENTPWSVGAKKSFVPLLGEIVWELPDKLAATAPFSAYICRVRDGRRIGYVRVPHYNHDEGSIRVFEDLIARFESNTEAMVLDQVNNPGGSIFHMYAILSTLTDRVLALPQHQISINEDDAAMAEETVRAADTGEAIPSEERPSKERVAYSRRILSEFTAGRQRESGEHSWVLTDWLYLGGVEEVLPAKNHYSKRIIVLINCLDFSAAEFLAAILQDNKRATLFGERTAGAGGCVRQIYVLGQEKFGIADLTLTWTIARRTNGQYIENVGVSPDVPYTETVDDVRHGYVDYRRALLATINA